MRNQLQNNSDPYPNTQLLPMTRLDEHIVRVVISTEQLPNFGVDLIVQLTAMVDLVCADESIRVVIFEGGPIYFSAGGSSAALTEAEPMLNILLRAIEIPHLLLDLPIPIIAAMAGHAIGGGFMLGMWSDIPLLAAESRYGMNAVKLGFPPVMGATELLPDLLGPSLAHQLLYRGRLIKGRHFQSAASSLAHAVFAKAAVASEALKIAQEIAETPRAVLVQTKRQLSLRRRAMLAHVSEAEESMLHALFAEQGIFTQIAERYPIPLNT